MPQQDSHRQKTPLRVDIWNNFYKYDSTTGAYVPVPQPAFAKQVAISHVQTFIFQVEATVAIESQIPGASGCEYVKARVGDMLLIWSDGKHKIVPPKNQKWIRDLVPDPTPVK